MTRTDFEQLVTELESQYRLEREVKGDDYSRPNEDVLHNFREVGARLELNPIKVWAVYFEKHVTAIERFVRDGVLSSETLNGRFTDIVNYAHLGRALIQEEANDASNEAVIAAAIEDSKCPLAYESEARHQIHEKSSITKNILNIMMGKS